MRTMRYARAGVLGILMAAVGCSSDKNAEKLGSMNTSNIQRVANIYAGFQNGKGNKGPKNEAEFKEFIKANDPAMITAMGFDPGNIDTAFVSERDGKPFKIRYNVGGGKGSVDPVVFEQDGVNGKKQVGYTGGKVEEVDDAAYKDLWAGKKPASAEPAGPATGPNSARPAGGGGGRPPGAPTGPPGG